MLTKSKIMLSLAIALSAASVANAAPKHAAHRHQVAQRVTVSAYQSFGSAQGAQGGRTVSGLSPDHLGDPYNHQERKCFGGACGADWGMYSAQ
jgi:hypothetical protein